MKDNLFEMLLNLFEKTLSQLKESRLTDNSDTDNEKQSDKQTSSAEKQAAFVKSAHPNSLRVFTDLEQIKFTKASYQFLVRVASWGILAPDVLELIINQLFFSESRFVTLQETKWTIRTTLAANLDAEQLAFLDLVLYHKEDKLPLH